MNPTYPPPTGARANSNPPHGNGGSHRHGGTAAGPANKDAVIGDSSLLDRMDLNPAVASTNESSVDATTATSTATSTSTANATSSRQQQELMQSLRAQLEDLQETNFDLQATMATLQAEQTYSMQQKEQQWKEELTKLQCALRLEQQTTQRLRQPPAASKRARVNTSSTSDVFRKRLPTNTNIVMEEDVPMEEDAGGAGAVEGSASPVAAFLPSPGGPPPEISLQRRPDAGRPSMGTTATAQSTPPPRPTTSPWPAETPHAPKMGAATPLAHRSAISGATWLARELLYLAPSESATTGSTMDATPSSLDIPNFLIPIATALPESERTAGMSWTEAQLVEYLLLFQQQHHHQTSSSSSSTAEYYWRQALTLSRAGRLGILQAMAETEERGKEEEEEDNAFENPSSAARRLRYPILAPASLCQRKPRIHRMNPDGTQGKALVDTRRAQRRNLWYAPGKVYTQESTAMTADAIQDWIGNRLDTHNPQHLQLLALILEDCPLHSSTIWWEILLPGIALELIPLHAKFTQWPAKKTATGNNSGGAEATTKPRRLDPIKSRKSLEKLRRTSSSGSKNNSSNAWADLGGTTRRLRFQSPTATRTSNNANDKSSPEREDADDLLLLACLTLLERLVSVTRLDILEEWYTRNASQAPKQPYQFENLQDAAEESGLLWIGLVLDILEGLDYYLYSTKPLELPIWYLQLISLLTTMGRATWGMTALRTRLPDSMGGDALPNALEAATMQLFHLSLMDQHDVVDYLDPAHQHRLVVMDAWIRLWQQVLFFVQEQHSDEGTTKEDGDNAPILISFRSLVLDLQDYYTSACTRVLTDPYVKPEIHDMIQQQLEELALDEEEHDDLKGVE